VSKDYKSIPHKGGGRGTGGSFLLGMVVGLILGLVLALGVAWYINKMPSPFLNRMGPAKIEPPKTLPPTAAKGEEKAAKAADSKPRFDFYKILPGSEEPATDQQFKDAQKQAVAAAKEAFYLQAGAFQNAPDADALKARLALSGVEATIQTTTLPDRGTWHRVRIGPYTSVEELARTRDTLRQNGVETTLIKVRDAAAQ
jgi:cell division protein FtsN